MVQAILAIDAGGTSFKSVLVSETGDVYADSFLQVPANASGAKQDIIGSYHTIIRRALAYTNERDIAINGMGISTPGPFDYEHGTSLMEHKFQAIQGMPLRERFYGEGLLSENLPIVFQQDVHSFLLGEHWTGAVKGVDNAAAITLGTGLGFGVMVDGHILDNGSGGPHCVVYNRAYQDGILEDRISRRGIIAAYQQSTNGEAGDIDVHDIANKARQDTNSVAANVLTETGQILGDELALLLSEYKVTHVVFGGQISRSFDLFGPAFVEALQNKGHSIQAAPGQDIEFSALKGAAKAVVA